MSVTDMATGIMSAGANSVAVLSTLTPVVFLLLSCFGLFGTDGILLTCDLIISGL